MSGPFGSDQWMYSSGGYEIDQSLRFNDDDSAYLTRTPASAGNRKTWTWSGWVKRGNIGADCMLYGAGNTSNNHDRFSFSSTDTLYAAWDYGGSNYGSFVTTAVFRDASAWYHVVLKMDTTQAVQSDRVNLYVNGVEQSITFGNLGIPQNFEWNINNSNNQRLGGWYDGGSASRFLEGYLAEVNFIDGQALDASYFGETDADYGHWKPIKYTGTYGTNGFYLDFSNSSSLGEDQSGNSNNWTSNNLAATDVVLDSPTNNFATLNPLWSTLGTLSEGNLKNVTPASGRGTRSSTISAASGKYYFEVYCQTLTYFARIGVIRADTTYAEPDVFTSAGYNGIGYLSFGGDVQSNGAVVSTGGNSYTTGDIIGVALDLDNNEVSFYKNGTQEYSGLNPSSLLDSGDWMFVLSDSSNSGGSAVIANFGQDSSFAGNKTAQGNTDANGIGDFYYAPPSGYLALCTQNLPEPTVAPADHFNTVLYTGNETARSITGVGFQPDWTWIKSRSFARSSRLFDAVRGATYGLVSNDTIAELTQTAELTSFDSDGFSLGNDYDTNANSQTYVAWNWKANGSGVSNTDGTITSTVSANQDAGFSIVSYTGNGTNPSTIGHGLGAVPAMVIAKSRSATGEWPTYHKSLTPDYTLYLNATYAASTYQNRYDYSAFTTDVFSTAAISGGELNTSGVTYIAYCFAEVDGFSKFGSYTGNGSTDGPFVYTGFRPAYLMVKRTDTTSQWSIWDAVRNTYNVAGTNLWADSSEAEVTSDASYGIDFTSNGFKLRNSHAARNASGGTYIFLAFAENPFKYANAR